MLIIYFFKLFIQNRGGFKMKLRSLISALIVFTLVMTCAMSAVSAARFTTTTNYSTSGVTVTTNVTGVTKDSMISYVIYGGEAPAADNIKYIDQKSVSGNDETPGTTSFTVTDSVINFDGKKIFLGSNGDTVAAEASEKIVNIDNDDSSLVVSYDGVVDKAHGSVTFLVSQNLTRQTGINVVATNSETDEVYEFNGLLNLPNTDDVYAKYYAIRLVDERENSIDFSKCEFVVTPVVNGKAMTNIGTKYWVESSEE